MKKSRNFLVWQMATGYLVRQDILSKYEKYFSSLQPVFSSHYVEQGTSQCLSQLRNMVSTFFWLPRNTVKLIKLDSKVRIPTTLMLHCKNIELREENKAIGAEKLFMGSVCQGQSCNACLFHINVGDWCYLWPISAPASFCICICQVVVMNVLLHLKVKFGWWHILT